MKTYWLTGYKGTPRKKASLEIVPTIPEPPHHYGDHQYYSPVTLGANRARAFSVAPALLCPSSSNSVSYSAASSSQNVGIQTNQEPRASRVRFASSASCYSPRSFIYSGSQPSTAWEENGQANDNYQCSCCQHQCQAKIPVKPIKIVKTRRSLKNAVKRILVIPKNSDERPSAEQIASPPKTYSCTILWKQFQKNLTKNINVDCYCLLSNLLNFLSK